MPIIPTFPTTDIELLPVPDAIFKNVSEGNLDPSLEEANFYQQVSSWDGFEALRIKNKEKNW